MWWQLDSSLVIYLLNKDNVFVHLQKAAQIRTSPFMEDSSSDSSDNDDDVPVAVVPPSQSGGNTALAVVSDNATTEKPARGETTSC